MNKTKPFSKDIILLDNIESVVNEIVTKLRNDVLHVIRRDGGVVGISGGIDSSVCLALSARAFGPDKVLGIMLPEKDSSPDSEILARELADKFGVKAIKEEMFKPVKQAKGVPPSNIIGSLQEVTAPIKYNLRRSKERLNQALAVIETLKKKLPELQAQDLHYLSKCHEVTSMVLCAELTFRAALMREESRGSHFREDYPARDDKKWLKWVIVKQQNGKMKLATQPVPVDKYKIKPV